MTKESIFTTAILLSICKHCLEYRGVSSILKQYVRSLGINNKEIRYT